MQIQVIISIICYRFLQLNYQFMKRCVETGPTMSIQDEWYYNILEMIPEKLKDKKEYREALKVLFDEVVTDFAKSMKKSMGKNFFVIFLVIIQLINLLKFI